MADTIAQADTAAKPVPMYDPANDLDAFSAPEAAPIASESAPVADPAEPSVTATEPKPEVVPPTEPVEHEPLAVAPVEVQAGDTPGDERQQIQKPILPGRIRTNQFDQIEQEAIAYRRRLHDAGETIGLKEAIEIIESKHAKATNAARAEAERAAATPDPLATLESEVIALETEINEAGENEALFNGALAKKVTTLARKSAELERRRLEAAQANNNHVQSQEQVKEQVLAEYPDASDKDTLLGARVAALIGELRDPDHPEHSRLLQPDAARYLVDSAIQRLAAKRGVPVETLDAEFKGQKPPEAQVAPVAPAKPAAPKPVAGNKAITPAAATLNTGAPPQAAPARSLRQVNYTPGEFDEDIFGKQRKSIAIGV